MNDGHLSRREFLRNSTLLGLSAVAAYTLVGTTDPLSSVQAQELPKGGNLRIGMRCMEIKDPHLADFAERSNVIRQVCEYLTITGRDNITRPYLLESWEASEDLKTWTLHLRTGRQMAQMAVRSMPTMWCGTSSASAIRLSAHRCWACSPAIWSRNTRPAKRTRPGTPKKSSRLWSENAIEKVDDHTVRLNAFAPQVAVAEHLFHYPMFILDPEDNGMFGPGANGTGPFELVEFTVGKGAKYKARTDYWGDGPYLDTFEFVDLGDNPGASIAAIASKQVDGLSEADAVQINAMQNFPMSRCTRWKPPRPPSPACGRTMRSSRTSASARPCVMPSTATR